MYNLKSCTLKVYTYIQLFYVCIQNNVFGGLCLNVATSKETVIDLTNSRYSILYERTVCYSTGRVHNSTYVMNYDAGFCFMNNYTLNYICTSPSSKKFL